MSKLKNIKSFRKGTFNKFDPITGKYDGKRRIFIGIGCDNYWWAKQSKKWVKDIPKNEDCSNKMDSCYSIRAFRRRLKEFSKYLPKGVEFTLHSIYVGYDIEGKI